MEKNSQILHELKEITPMLAKIDNRTPYTTSPNYFSHLADNIIEKVTSDTELKSYFTKESPYAVPAGYFDTLPATIVQKIKRDEKKSAVTEEMDTISPLLNTINKRPVYSVPPGYLDSVNWNKSDAFVRKAPVVAFTRVSKLIKYVAAAVIIGLLAIGIFMFTGKQNTDTARTKAASELKQLSEQEIVDFLKTNSPTENVVSAVNNNNVKENDIKSSVSKMSDNEIQQFLQENGELVEM